MESRTAHLPYRKSLTAKQRAYLRIGEILATHLDVLDMTTGLGAETLCSIVETDDDAPFELAACFRAVGSGKLADALLERMGKLPRRRAKGGRR